MEIEKFYNFDKENFKKEYLYCYSFNQNFKKIIFINEEIKNLLSKIKNLNFFKVHNLF